MSQEPLDATASQIVQLLSTLDVSAISTHQDLRYAVLSLIERSEKSFRDEVVTRINANKRPRKSAYKRTPEEEQLVAYFAENEYSGAASSEQPIERLARALKGLRSSLSVSADAFQVPTEKEKEHLSRGTFFARTTGCRQERVMQHYRMCAQKTYVTEGWRRLYLLWVIYEVDRLMSNGERVGTDMSDVAYAESEFSRLSGENKKTIRALRDVSRSYVTAANRENGLGIIMMLGPQSRDAWERGRILDNDAVSCLWRFCESKHSQLKVKAKALQRVACATIRQGFSEYDIDPAELFEEGHVFSRHFRAVEASQDSSAGLQALVAAADQVQANNPGLDADLPQYHPEGEMRSQQQLSGATLDMAAMNQHVSTAKGVASCGSDSGFASGSGAYGDSVAIDRAQASALPQTGSGQIAQHPWQRYTDPCWMQGTVAQNEPCSGSLYPPFDQTGEFGESSADIVNWEQWIPTIFDDCGAR